MFVPCRADDVEGRGEMPAFRIPDKGVIARVVIDVPHHGVEGKPLPYGFAVLAAGPAQGLVRKPQIALLPGIVAGVAET